MIASMTGYGDAQRTTEGVSFSLELRSLNNRYYKAVIKLPEGLQFMEADIDRMLHERLGRGSIHCSLKTRSDSASAAYAVNAAALASYVEKLDVSGLPAGIAPTVDLAALLSLPGVCQPPETDEDIRAAQWATVEEMLGEALTKVIAMRQEEGQALRDDLLGHCGRMRELVELIAMRSPIVLREYQDRLRQRVAALLAAVELMLNQDDLMREIAIFADRCDISEELARLGSHLDQFGRFCDGSEPAGRKLDFLTQELLREANTITSKSNDTTISHHAVELKSLIDRLKEQVQNVQ